MILTDLLWPLDYMTLTSLALLCICHLILPPFTLSCDLDTHCIHYLALIFLILIPGPVTLSHTSKNLHWLIKLTKPGIMGRLVVGDQGGVLGRAAPPRALPHVILCSCDLCSHLLLHVIWYLSTVNCFSLLSGSTNASLIWYAVVLWDGAQDGCIS